MEELRGIDFFQVESRIWVAKKTIHVPAYDFAFEPLLKIARPRLEEECEIIARIGAIADYPSLYKTFQEQGFRLVNTPAQHKIGSELSHWYEDIQDLTPKSKVYGAFPDLEEFYKDFSFPVFIKGNRQTAKHNPELSVARSEEDYIRISKAYQQNAILHWQKIVVREFVPLKPIPFKAPDKVQISVEFRSFWWKNQCVGVGHYWSQYLSYTWTPKQESEALKLAQEAANRLNVPFLVIDLALTAEDSWIIIECNDAQESGYCGVKPLKLWQNILEIESRS